jgi:hypothetical protein
VLTVRKLKRTDAQEPPQVLCPRWALSFSPSFSSPSPSMQGTWAVSNGVSTVPGRVTYELLRQNDNSCGGLPLPSGIPSTTQEGTAKMTCNKGDETVFNNHQMYNVMRRVDDTHMIVYLTYSSRRWRVPRYQKHLLLSHAGEFTPI